MTTLTVKTAAELTQLLEDTRLCDEGDTIYAERYTTLGGKVADRNGDKVMVVIAAHWAKLGNGKHWAPTRVEVWNTASKERVASVTAGTKWREAVKTLKPYMV